MEKLLLEITSLAKRRGFVFPSSEIYGGLAGVYDYGPLGVELLRNIKSLWWKDMVQKREDILGLDGSILMHPKAWEASGHVEGFTDPLVDCKDCKRRIRADQLKDWEVKKNKTGKWEILKKGSLKCPECGGELIPKVRQFNILMETELGVIENEKQKVYLKGESCQNIYLDYLNVLDSFSPHLPFGIAQIGKAFRNEISFGKFIFKTREFEQYDIEYFTAPQDADKFFEKWKKIRFDWYVNRLGIKKENLRFRQHPENERIFYAKDAWDIEYKYPWGWDELEGIHNRGDYDLIRHAKFSGKRHDYFDQESGKRIVPHIIECSGGVGRTFLAVFLDAFNLQEKDGKKRQVMSFDSKIAPSLAAVFPLVSNKEKLTKKAREVYKMLSEKMPCAWDDIGNIGKKYRRQDEAGTPKCVTIDYQTLEDNTVTVRDRDTMKQERVELDKLLSLLNNEVCC